MANRTMHGVMHLSWVEKQPGSYRARMAVYVKPNGRFGALYMAVIKPFRRFIVYPRLVKQLEKTWSTRARDSRSTASPLG